MLYTTDQLIQFLKDHKAFFAKEFTVTRIGLFGSSARGEATEESDIDIVVELEKPDLFYLIGVKQAVEEAFGHKVDVVRLRDNMNAVLKKRIEQDVIYV